MLPLILKPVHIKVGLAGEGPGRERRAALLADAGMEVRLLPEVISDELLEGLQLLFVAGLPKSDARALVGRAGSLGILVNVEDMPDLCDFHVPAIVRRGELLLTASTGGQVPGLARALREHLAQAFGPEWTARLKELGAARARWRSEGLPPHQVSQHVRELVMQMGWL